MLGRFVADPGDARDLARFRAAALREQIARRLRDRAPDHEHVQRRQRSDQQRDAPARGRHDERADQRREHGAVRPEALEQHDRAAAALLRCELAHQRARDRQLAAEPEPREEPDQRQRPRRPGERRQPGQQAVRQQRPREHRLAPEPVGDDPAQRRSQEHPDQVRGDDPADDGLGEMPLLAGGADDASEQQQVHRVEEPAAARGQEEASLKGHGRRAYARSENIPLRDDVAPEAVEQRRPPARVALPLAGRLDELRRRNQPPEVPGVQPHPRERLDRSLQLRERERRRQQLEHERTVSQRAAHPSDRRREDAPVVERHRHPDRPVERRPRLRDEPDLPEQLVPLEHELGIPGHAPGAGTPPRAPLARPPLVAGVRRRPSVRPPARPPRRRRPAARRASPPTENTRTSRASAPYCCRPARARARTRGTRSTASAAPLAPRGWRSRSPNV